VRHVRRAAAEHALIGVPGWPVTVDGEVASLALGVSNRRRGARLVDLVGIRATGHPRDGQSHVRLSRWEGEATRERSLPIARAALKRPGAVDRVRRGDLERSERGAGRCPATWPGGAHAQVRPLFRHDLIAEPSVHAGSQRDRRKRQAYPIGGRR